MKFSHRWAYLCVALLLLSVIAAAAAEDVKQSTVDNNYPGMSWGPLGRATLAELPEGTLLTVGGLKITRADLNSEIAETPSGIRPQLSNYSFFFLEQTVTRKLLSIEAKAWAEKGKVEVQPDQLIRTYLEGAVPKVEVSEEEVEKVRKENEDHLGLRTPDQQKSDVRNALENQKRGEAVEKYVKSIGGRHKISISAPWMDGEYQKWIKNPVEQARRSGKPSLLNFMADWCAPCQYMAPKIESLKNEYKDKVSIVVVDTEKEPVISAHYEANALPTLVFYDKNGREVFRHTGVMEKEDIEEKLKSLEP